ncbi:hypothetical protein ACIOYV_26760 [Pseudomonas sp. NPDC087342]|uniref:hypothetical protein n=1 Tax=Pseudomonas sp. NPDC087342 TaxID=3364437 RepID=UPI0038286038
MQTITPGGLFPPTHPTEAQLHTGQLEDYQLMLSAMNEPPNLVHLFNPIPIGPFSPLHRVSEDGLNALWHLLRDRDYINMCTKHQIKHGDLNVTLEEGQYVYRGWSNEGYKVTLDLMEQASWQALKHRIERAATLLGGQINSNRTISLGRMCGFYGLVPWKPRHPQEHPAAINALQEKIASHQLRLEDDFDILVLRRRPTDKDRAVFRAHRRDSPEPSQIDIQKIHAGIIRAEIIDTLNQFRPDQNTSPLTHLANTILADTTLEQVRATPTVYLQKILQSTEAEQLGVLLLSTLDWYGGEIGEDTSPFIKTRLIAQALQLWLTGPTDDHTEEIAGYAWQARANWGKSYQAIQADFETHLLKSKRASSEKEAIVIARLFLPRFPSEFRVTGIPAELAYKSSIVWVNFVTGVNLIKASDPRSLERLNFQQLANLPLLLSENATTETLKYIGLARLMPTLDWAQTYGVIAQKPYDQYTQKEVERALAELDKYTEQLNNAVIQLNEEPPERLSIGKREMAKLFGKDAFISDGRKLARKLGPPVSVSRDVPYLPGKDYDYYSFLDVLASGKFDNQEKWRVTEADGTTLSKQWIRINEHRTIKTEGAWPAPESEFVGLPIVMSPFTKLPDVKALFETEFEHYVKKTTAAYETLIRSLIASLPCADRLALEFGAVKIHSLRKESQGIEAQNETPELILPLRARNGLILQATHAGNTTHYELLPKAGVIRRLEKLESGLFSGALQTERWRVSRSGTVAVSVWRHKDLPFDWDAHSNGSAPRKESRCQAIIEQLGDTLDATPYSAENAALPPQTLSSYRTVKISHAIASGLLFVDPKALRNAAYGQTQFDRKSAWYEKVVAVAKMLVPFWSSIEDLDSGDKTRLIHGAFGLFVDVISFALPIGKFASGSMQLVARSSRLTLRATLPSFRSLTLELVISIAGALNPLDGPLSLLNGLSVVMMKLGRAGRFRLMELLGRAGRYNFVRSHPQVGDVGHWKPLVDGEELARVNGVDDVSVRNLASAGKSDYRLVDPLSSKLFGPTLATKSGELSPGRSRYDSLGKIDNHALIEVPEHTRVREVLEVDGRTTIFLDDIPYRLDGDTLRRADLIDDDALKAIPCRISRAPGTDVCKTRYVTREPAPVPSIGSYDETKGWADWFGDVIYTPATDRAPMRAADIARHANLDATLEFQKGIYGRVMLSVPEPRQQLVDNLRVGAIIVESMDESRHYIYIRINAGDFYVAERLKGQKAHELLTFRKAETLPKELNAELKTVYTGSLNANNMARIHGTDAVERALKTMEEIAIPIGGHARPPETLQWLKVDTSPGEALLFDHSTRMIVSRLPEGATSWSRSMEASEPFRQRTAEIFDTLFVEKTISTPMNSNLKIHSTMNKLQKLLPKRLRTQNARNIAYAEVITAAGAREVYVSVSGAQGLTGYLPLFQPPFPHGQVIINGTTYFNIDFNRAFTRSSLNVSPDGKLLAVPHTIKDIDTYQPALTSRPTSLDSEAKLISVIREKYPNREMIQSVNIATTMPPCNSCSVVVKEFGYDGGENALQVLWN